MTSRRPEDVFIALLRSVYQRAQHGTIQWGPARPVLSLELPSTQRLSSRQAIGRRGLHSSSGHVSRAQRRAYATSEARKEAPREIAVLGGGITGLTTAHYLARHATNANITLYEASGNLGGWVEAERAQVNKGQPGDVLLQHGPRMLRSGASSQKYDDLVLYDVSFADVCALRQLASLEMQHKIRPFADPGNRYLYYPDRLVKLPSGELSVDNIVGTIRSWLNDSIWDGTLRSFYNYWTKYQRSLVPGQILPASPAKMLEKDESVGEFMTRVFEDDRPVKNMLSGIMHGIYGGDVNKLSAKHTMLDRMWYQLTLPVPEGQIWMANKDWYLLYDTLNGPNRLKVIETAEKAISWNTLAFDDGLLSLVDGLVKDLEKQSNVTIKYDAPVTSLSYNNDQVSVITAKTDQPNNYDQVISTLFSRHLSQIVQPPNSLPSLAETHAITIMVVNLWYPTPGLLRDIRGFGYLIPSSTPDNDECALGVLFDSDLQTRDEVPGTKLTVMLGGHHWDEWESLPTEEMGAEMAKQIVKRHLGIDDKEEVVVSSRLCRECLPQHYVGHRERMNKAHYELLSTFQGKLTVAGPSYTTIGVIPSMRAGFDAAMRVARGHGPPWFRYSGSGSQPDWWTPILKRNEQTGWKIRDHVGATGLEGFTESEFHCMYPSPKESLMFRKWTGAHSRFLDDDGQWITSEGQEPGGFRVGNGVTEQDKNEDASGQDRK
ncbi:Uu.00g038120.m01.CDS01 [Anthostomella pinea]|uniref:protoporphyrinogen oxidase n=1 Tax=Anthostomella pinea TaxID=933095 RepID=A0AAI8V9R0_9PEZI|nr:Uu.00g038120.m01.CDS01 [Anthostomella pinea]